MSVQHILHDGSRDAWDDRDRPYEGGIIWSMGLPVPEQNPESIHADPLAPTTRCSSCGANSQRSPCGPCRRRRMSAEAKERKRKSDRARKAGRK